MTRLTSTPSTKRTHKKVLSRDSFVNDVATQDIGRADSVVPQDIGDISLKTSATRLSSVRRQSWVVLMLEHVEGASCDHCPVRRPSESCGGRGPLRSAPL